MIEKIGTKKLSGDIVFINTAEYDYSVNDVIIMFYGKEKLINRIRGISSCKRYNNGCLLIDILRQPLCF